MKKFSSLLPILTLLLIILISFSASCDKRNPPPVLPTIPPPPPVSELRIFTRITASPSVIYADNNITYSSISVEVKDGEGFGVLNQTVSFKTNLGRVLTNVPTDSTGVAKTIFWDDGDIGMATINAVVRKYHASIADSIVSEDTISTKVEIKPIPPIADVNLRLPSELRPYPMTVMTSITVTAIPTNTAGENVPNNTLVTFSCTKGRFVDNAGNELGNSAIASTFNGQASVRYSSWTDATSSPGTVNAFIKAAIGGVEDQEEILIRPGRPAAIDLRKFVKVGANLIEADTSSVGSPNEIWIHAGLNDVYSNACPSQPVKFTTDLGSFMNTNQTVNTNTELSGEYFGWARVRFTPGLSAGAASIQATANGDTLMAQTIFTVTSNELYSISFTQSDQINLNVANTGGLQSAILRVKLRDINGNLIDAPQKVYFKIANMNAPDGANLNDYPQADSVEVISNGGEAQVSVNSGTDSGILRIRASWISDDGLRYIYALKTNIVIHAGPPVPGGIVGFISGFNTGTNMGGGLWRVVAGAQVKDIHNNPVDKGTAVWFSLVNNPPCQIVAEAYVGNVSVNGDSLAGVAYTILTYDGTLTYDVVIIRVNCGDDALGNPVFGDSDVILPLNEPRYQMQAQPAVLYYDNLQTTPEYADIYFKLSDGQGCFVENAYIMLYSSDGGRFVQNLNGLYDPNLPPNEWWMIITDITGMARGRIAYHPAETNPPDPDTGQPVPASKEIHGAMLEAGVDTTTDVTLLRYGGTAPW